MINPAPPDPPELDGVLWEGFGPSRVSYDVGANCGQTLGRISEFTPGLIVAFEPAAEAYEYLVEHFGDWDAVVLSNLAVSSSVGTVELMAAPSKIETGQLVTHGTAGMEWSDDEMANGVIRVLSSVTLDAYSMANGVWPDFIKIDVEGHEGEVLKGATEVLKRGVELLIEVHSESLGEFITDLLGDSHRLETVRHPHYEPGSLLWRTHFWLRCFPK